MYKTYKELTLLQKVLARKEHGENVENILYDFDNKKVMEMDIEVVEE